MKDFYVFPTALLALSAAILFAIEIDSINRSFIVTRGISFYLQVMCIFRKKPNENQPFKITLFFYIDSLCSSLDWIGQYCFI